MQRLTLEMFNELLANSTIKPRLKKELRFVTSTEHLSDEDWDESELIAVTDRSANKGVLVAGIDEGFFLIPYEIKVGITSSSTGRSQSIICDFCQTWQYGNRSGSISFQKDRTTTVSYLCCADLQCSQHVRNKTEAARTSRAQLREDLTIDQRINRLKSRMMQIIETLPVKAITNL